MPYNLLGNEAFVQNQAGRCLRAENQCELSTLQYAVSTMEGPLSCSNQPVIKKKITDWGLLENNCRQILVNQAPQSGIINKKVILTLDHDIGVLTKGSIPANSDGSISTM